MANRLNNLSVQEWHPTFARDEVSPKKAIDYISDWSSIIAVHYLANAVSTVQKYGTPEDWKNTEAILKDKLPMGFLSKYGSIGCAVGSRVAMDYNENFLMRIGDGEWSREDKFVAKSISDLRLESNPIHKKKIS